MCSHCLIVQTIPVENNEENLIRFFFFFFGELPNTSVMKCIDQHESSYLHEPVAALFVSFGKN